MPFSEIIGMAKRKVDVTHQKPYYLSTDNSFGCYSGGSELEWRNGEIAVVQAESSRARNGHDFIDVNNAKMGMFSTVESMLDDCELVLDEDDRAVPFLDCPIAQPLKNNECLHELEFSGNDEFINSSNSNHVMSEFALSNAAAIVPILEQQSTLPRSGNSDKTHCHIGLTNSAYFSRVPELNVHATLQVVTSDENKGSTHNRQSAVPRTSSVSGGSSSSERASNDPVLCTGLKRKTETSEGPSDEDEEESASNYTASKRRRAYQVHNLSGRVRNATWTKRRRYRVNEKMRELKQLIPNCNQVDKASLLDEAIKYLQTLQLQWQMLSMGSGMYMSPMMLQATMQQALGGYMSPMGFGMGMHDANYSIGAAMHNPVPGHPVSTPMFDGAVGYSHQSGQQVPPGCVPFPIFAGMPNSFINHNSAGLEFDFTTTTNKYAPN